MTTNKNRAQGHIRIIAGQWRGRKLNVLSEDGLRPTTDRTKETLFNWLMNKLQDTRCLDAFAGTGSLGIEALSRGAKHSVFFEKNKTVVRKLRENLQQINASSAEICCGDSIQSLTQQKIKFDVVFADPPFNKGLLVPFVEQLVALELLQQGGWLYLEHEVSLSLPQWNQLSLRKEKNTKQFRYALYQKN